MGICNSLRERVIADLMAGNKNKINKNNIDTMDRVGRQCAVLSRE